MAHPPATHKAADGIGGSPQGRTRVQHIRTIMAGLCLLGCAVATAAPPGDGRKPVRRIRGIIDQDETWVGHIIITGDLQVVGAAVTIQPGTLVEFADAAPGGGPVLTVGSAKADGGELRVLATPKEPVTFRTRPGTKPGRIVVHLHDRRVAAPRGAGNVEDVPARASNRPTTLAWRHIRFEQLGGAGGGGTLGAAAMTIHLAGEGQRATITDCALTRSGRLLVKVGDGAAVTIAGNRFLRERGRVGLEVSGTAGLGKPAAVTLARNQLTAAILVDGSPAEIVKNILIGINASIVVRGGASTQTTIKGNYAHNTTSQDDGRYCLSAENPDVLIENNILRGGSVCVHRGSRRMTGNVLIAAERLDVAGAKPTPTRELVASLPHGAVFERNILLGPTHSMLVPQPTGSRPDRKIADPTLRIRGNTFDGFGATTRAIHLNATGRLPARVWVSHNLFVRVRSLVFDESLDRTTLIYADQNAYAPRPPRPFDRAVVVGVPRGELGWAASDIERQSPTQLGLLHIPHRLPKADDEALRSGRKTIVALRAEYEALYRPQRGSPLDESPAEQQVGAIPPNRADTSMP